MFSAPVGCNWHQGKRGCRPQRMTVNSSHQMPPHQQSKSFCLWWSHELRGSVPLGSYHAVPLGLLRWGKHWIKISPTCVIIRCRKMALAASWLCVWKDKRQQTRPTLSGGGGVKQGLFWRSKCANATSELQQDSTTMPLVSWTHRVRGVFTGSALWINIDFRVQRDQREAVNWPCLIWFWSPRPPPSLPPTVLHVSLVFPVHSPRLILPQQQKSLRCCLCQMHLVTLGRRKSTRSQHS